MIIRSLPNTLWPVKIYDIFNPLGRAFAQVQAESAREALALAREQFGPAISRAAILKTNGYTKATA